MIFINHYRIKDGKRDEVIKRRLEIGRKEPAGTKILGEWSALEGNRGYLVFETDQPDYSWTMTWSDLLDMEVIPVLDTEKDVMKLLK